MTKKTTRPTTTDSEAIQRCQAEGMTRQQAAEAVGVSLSTVARYWQQGQQRPNAAEAAAKRQEAYARLDAGESIEAVAAALDVTASTVRRYRRDRDGARAYKRADA